MSAEDTGQEARPTSTPIGSAVNDARPSLSHGNSKRLGPDGVMQLVESELAVRRGASRNVDASPRAEPWASPLSHAANPVDVRKTAFVLDDLLQSSDVQFVESAYLALLRRNADSAGAGHYLSALRSGAMSKVEILGALRWSAEGRARSVHVDGLLVPYTLRRLQRKPVVGPVISWVVSFARLGQLSRKLQQVELGAARDDRAIEAVVRALEAEARNRQGAIDARLRGLADSQAELEGKSTRAMAAIDEKVIREAAALAESVSRARLASEESINELVGRVQANVDALKPVTAAIARVLGDLSGLCDRVAHLDSAVGELPKLKKSLAATEASHANALARVSAIQSNVEALAPLPSLLASLEAQLARERVRLDAELERVDTVQKSGVELVARHETLLANQQQVLQRLQAGVDEQGAMLSDITEKKVAESENARALDPMYAAFEDHFRGGREIVRTRAEPYVDLVIDAGAGTPAAPVLDLGCGRGEWLELLRDRGLTGRGIDNNRVFVDICLGRGLDVMEGDVMDVLRTLPSGTLGAVTGFHIVEHLPFDVLVRLLDEARRLLVPGGLLALETPNPENLQVATQLFYMDPTHRNPIPPDALQWIVQSRGFDQARIERLTLAREMGAPALLGEEIPGAASVNVLLAQLSTAPDYAIVARRGAG